MTPLWEVLNDPVTKGPKTSLSTDGLEIRDVKRLMLEAGDVISAEEAERRVLVLENPGMPGKARITNSLSLAFSCTSPVRSPMRINTFLLPFGSCWKARVLILRSRARRRR